MNEPSLRRTGKACLLFLGPLLLLYVFVVAADKGVGFAPAYAQEGPTTTEAPTTTEEPPSTEPPSTTEPEHPTTTEQPTTTRTETTIGPPSTTYMPPHTTWTPQTGPSGGGPGPTNAPSNDCSRPIGVTEVTWHCNGSTWICHDKQTTPGTYCIDP